MKSCIVKIACLLCVEVLSNLSPDSIQGEVEEYTGSVAAVNLCLMCKKNLFKGG